MEKAAKLSLAFALSVTVITIFVYVPKLSLVGIPLNSPVALLKFAQLGLLTIENVLVSPLSTSVTVGTKLYRLSSAADIFAVPLMTGASLTLVTVISNAFKLTLKLPLSVTVMMIFEWTPTSVSPGVPLNWPVAESKSAHAGLLVMEKVLVSPVSTSVAVGVKL